MQPQRSLPTKTRTQIADEYSICARTLKRWLDRANIELPSRMLTPKEQEMIYAEFGYPTIEQPKKKKKGWWK